MRLKHAKVLKSVLFFSFTSTLAVFMIASAFPVKKQRTEIPTNVHVWPIPYQMTLSGPSISISKAFSINTLSKSAILGRGITRYLKFFTSAVKNRLHGVRNDAEVNVVAINVENDDETLGMETSYKYEIVFKATNVVSINADSPFGALYGLETLYQLTENGKLVNNHIHIVDQPSFLHRGLMLDTGRRFIPIELIYNTLDAMSFVKLNVLHFHLSDVCRFSVESKLYPELRNNEQQIHTQEDIKNIVAYARNRGIRVVPEVESASHANGLVGIDKNNLNMHFCKDKVEQPGYLELYNDEKGVTLATMKALLNEMMSLFPDELFHLGLDEIFDTSLPCTLLSMAGLETALLQHVTAMNKTTVAWEEAFTWTKTVLPSTVVQAWKGVSIKEIVGKKLRAIASMSSQFYLDSKSLTPAKLWTDISQGLTEDETKYLLGGEMAMWTDAYCYIWQCYLPTRPKPQAWWMFKASHDAQFIESVSGLIWPRAIVGAGSFWNYKHDLKPDSTQFHMQYQAAHRRLLERHILACPLRCQCDYLNRCGKPYPKYPWSSFRLNPKIMK